MFGIPSFHPAILVTVSRSYWVNSDGRPLTAAVRRRRGNQDAGGGSGVGDAGGGLVTFSRYRLEHYRWIHNAIVCTAVGTSCRRLLCVFTLLRNSLFRSSDASAADVGVQWSLVMERHNGPRRLRDHDDYLFEVAVCPTCCRSWLCCVLSDIC